MFKLQPPPRTPQKTPIAMIGMICGVLLFCLILVALWNIPRLLGTLPEVLPPQPALQASPRRPQPLAISEPAHPVVNGASVGDNPAPPAPPTPTQIGANAEQTSDFPRTPTPSPTWAPPPGATMTPPTPIPAPNVSGQLRFANGKPGTNIAVGIFASATGNCPDPANSTFSIGAAVAEDGHFQASGLPKAGHYCLQLMTLWDRQLSAMTPFTLTDPAGLVDLGVITLPTPPKHLTGSIHDQQGAPIVGSVHLARKADNAYAGGNVDLQSDANGAFAVDVNGGAWEVSVYPTGDAWSALGIIPAEIVKTVDFALDEQEETQNLAFALTMPASIAGRILAPDGQPLGFGDGRFVSIETLAQDGKVLYSASQDENGRFLVRAASGQNWLRLVVRGFTDYFSSGLRQVQVNNGESVNLGDLQLVGIVQATALLLRNAHEPVAQRGFRLLPVTTQAQCPATVAALPTATPPPQPEIPSPGPPALTPVGTEMLYIPSGEISGFTDSQGRIRLGGLPVGAYCLVILSPDDPSPLAAPPPRFFEIKADASPLDLGTLTLPLPTKQIVGVARTTTGAPLPSDFFISVVRQAPPTLSSASFNAGGAFNIPVTGGDWVVSLKQMGDKPPTWSVLNNDQAVHFAADVTAETQTLTFTLALPGAAPVPAASAQMNLYLPLVNK